MCMYVMSDVQVHCDTHLLEGTLGLPTPPKQNPEWYTTHTTTTTCYHLSCCINIIVVAYVLLLFVQGKVQSPPHNIIESVDSISRDGPDMPYM